jgi:hypothetical protein
VLFESVEPPRETAGVHWARPLARSRFMHASRARKM